jgi:hypothetical protein
MNTPRSFRILMTLAFVLGGTLAGHGADYAAAMPTYLGRPGALVPVPLTLNDASGLAGITARINYDPALLSVESVTAGELGAAFTLDQSAADGVVALIFTRTENLPAGQGRLGVIYFRINAGATDALFSDLAIAGFALSDSTGVIDLMSGGNTLSLTPGKLTVSTHGWIDNDQDKLPDPWETLHGLSLLADDRASDPDADGLFNLAEYALGTNPKQSGAAPQRAGATEAGGQKYLTLAFPRLVGAQTGVAYAVRESADLLSWHAIDLGTNAVSTAANEDGTETVTVRGNLPLSGPGATARAFLRLDIAPVP